MAKKNGMNFYYDWVDPLSQIPTEEFKPFIIAMLEYEQGAITMSDIPKFNSKEAQIASKFVFPQIDRARRNADNGSKGGSQTQSDKAMQNVGLTVGLTDGLTDGLNTNTYTYTNTKTNTKTNTNANKRKRKVSAKADTDTYNQEFESLWKKYPNKKGKSEALKSYVKARKEGETFEAVERGIESYNKQIKAFNTQPEFIKHGSAWFKQCSWNDEYNTQSGHYSASTVNNDDLDEFF